MNREYLNEKENNKIKELARKKAETTLPIRQLTNDEWLDRREWNRIASERGTERFTPKNLN